MPIRTRFAPSPTGHLHVGGARTAILNWLLARRHGGAFVLRIEDTDRERNVPGAEAALLDDLRWLGLDWDEGPDVGGPHAPYRQSERWRFYQEYQRKLLHGGHAYWCTCPPVEQAASMEGRRRCPCARREPSGAAPSGAALRFRVPAIDTVAVDDLIRGRVEFPAGDIEDFVLVRSDGLPTYNFAAAVDDAEMRITHVVRGADHLNNTPKQVLIYQALGRELPRFAHIPLILGPDRQKLSKRHGATSVAEHRRQGFLPGALFNYLSLLSWSSPSGEEFLPRERLVAEMELDRVGSSDAVFDRDKLRWLSSRYIQEMPAEELARALAPFIDRERFPVTGDALPTVAAALRERISTLAEANSQLDHFFPPVDGERVEARARALADPEARRVLAAVRARLAALAEWEEGTVNAAIREAGRSVGAKGRALFLPVRLALTGEEHGPELPRIAGVLGRERTLALLDPGEAEIS
ncbi:MAG TPA: glutamate--tRNA ligase [Longimicrobiaceae bacterium]|nr:glutamate--tRNA ligase [Longimicrobiaceae bacterium]